MTSQRQWEWDYWSAYVNADGSVSWSNHEHKASTRQSGKEFLAKGPAEVVVRMGSVPSRIVREMAVVVRELLKTGQR